MAGEEIRDFRKKIKLTQKELALKLGVTSQTVANWEQGISKPSILARRQLERLKNKRRTK